MKTCRYRIIGIFLADRLGVIKIGLMARYFQYVYHFSLAVARLIYRSDKYCRDFRYSYSQVVPSTYLNPSYLWQYPRLLRRSNNIKCEEWAYLYFRLQFREKWG